MLQFMYIFLISHLLGDFVFQSNKIAIMKSQSVKGIGVHVMIVGAIKVVMMGSFYGLGGVVTALGVACIHFAIDLMKFKLKARIKKIQTLYFIFDQCLHLTVLFVASRFWNTPESRYDLNTDLLFMIILWIVAYYVLSILVKYLMIDWHLTEPVPFFRKYERYLDGGMAVGLVSGIMLFGYLGLVIVLLAVPYWIYQERLFGYNTRIILLKVSVFFVFSWMGLLL